MVSKKLVIYLTQILEQMIFEAIKTYDTVLIMKCDVSDRNSVSLAAEMAR